MGEKKTKLDPNSRDWTKADIDQDPRFKQCLKEVFICMGIWAGFAAAYLICMFVIGAGDPLQYRFILGIPEWLFWQMVVSVVTIVVVFIVLDKCFKHMSLEADGEIEDKKKK